MSADGSHLFVANEDVGEASVVAVADGTVLATFKVGGEPEGVDLRPDGQVVYVTSEEDRQVAVIDAVNQKLLKTFKVGAASTLDDVSAGRLAGVRHVGNGGSVSYVDAQKHVVLKTIPITGRCSGRWAWPPDGKHVFITTGRGKNVAIIDKATQQVLAAIEVGERPWGVAVSGDGKTIFTANGPSNDVSIVDVESRMVKATVKVGDRPWGALLP